MGGYRFSEKIVLELQECASRLGGYLIPRNNRQRIERTHAIHAWTNSRLGELSVQLAL